MKNKAAEQEGQGEWQLCPKCNGEGQVITGLGMRTGEPIYKRCPVCNGAKILARPTPSTQTHDILSGTVTDDRVKSVPSKDAPEALQGHQEGKAKEPAGEVIKRHQPVNRGDDRDQDRGEGKTPGK